MRKMRQLAARFTVVITGSRSVVKNDFLCTRLLNIEPNPGLVLYRTKTRTNVPESIF